MNNHIVLKFDRHLGSDAADEPVKFQSDWESLSNLAASTEDFTRSCGKTSIRLVNRGPDGRKIALSPQDNTNSIKPPWEFLYW